MWRDEKLKEMGKVRKNITISWEINKKKNIKIRERILKMGGWCGRWYSLTRV